MGSTHKLSLPKTNSNLASKKTQALHRVTSVVKPKSVESKTNISKPSSSSVINNASRAESGPSIRQVVDNKKRAVTIIKAAKPDLKPPKNEPKVDPLRKFLYFKGCYQFNWAVLYLSLNRFARLWIGKRFFIWIRIGFLWLWFNGWWTKCRGRGKTGYWYINGYQCNNIVGG